MVNYEYLRPYAETGKETAILDAILAHGTVTAAVASVPGDNRNAMRILSKMKRRAATAGVAPESDMTKPAAEGFSVKGVSSLYDADGVLKAQWVKTRVEPSNDAADRMVSAIEAVCDRIKPFRPVKSPKSADADLLTQYTFTDYHLAQYSYWRETGDNWDVDIARDTFGCALSDMMDGSPDSETGLFLNMGDWCHFDSMQPVTPTSGFILDADTRADKMVEMSLEMHIHAIEALLRKHKRVKAIIMEGNHDMMSSIWLRKAVKKIFARNERVEIDDTAFPYYATTHGDFFLGYHHGHKKKNKELPALFSSEPRYRSMWGACHYAYIHSGHYHHAEQDQAEYGGAVVERHPTLAGRDSHATRGGYTSLRRAHAITYHKRNGEDTRKSVMPRLAA